MMKATRLLSAMLAFSCCASAAIAQDSVDVTFSYTNVTASAVNLVGEFEVWSNSNPAYVMTNNGAGLFTKTTRLRIGGNPSGGVPGAWQYKFFPAGTQGAWPNDPLNPHINANDNDNSYLYTKDPTFYHTLPNQLLPNLTTATPTITSYIYPKVGSSVDTSSIRLLIDTTTISGIGAFYDTTTKQLSYPLSKPLANGSHTMIISASSLAGGSNADTVSFHTQGGFVQITNPGGYTTRTSQRTIYGIVQSSSVTSISIVRNNIDTVSAPVTAGSFSADRKSVV